MRKTVQKDARRNNGFELNCEIIVYVSVACFPHFGDIIILFLKPLWIHTSIYNKAQHFGGHINKDGAMEGGLGGLGRDKCLREAEAEIHAKFLADYIRFC